MSAPKAKPELTERGGNLTEVFVDDLCHIETIGSVSHLVFATTRRELYEGKLERVAEIRLIVPADRIAEMALAMLAGRVEKEPIEEHAALN